MTDIPEELRVHAALLHKLARAKPDILKKQLKHLHAPVIRTLKRISRNYLKGNVKLSPLQFKRLQRHKKNIRELALSKTSLNRSRQILQKGGFISSILIPLISLFTSLFSKKKRR